MKYYLDTTLQELFDGGLISVRTFNSLRYAGMNTLEDVYQVTKGIKRDLA